MSLKETSETHLRKRIFIGSANSKLGYHIIEYLRDDHCSLENHAIIVGSSTMEIETQMHCSLHRLLNYEQEKLLLAKCVLESDLVILPLLGEQNQQTQYILEILKERNRVLGSTTRPIKVIGIGSHMTWAFSKNRVAESNNAKEKEARISKVLDWRNFGEGEWAQPKNASHCDKRLPHHFWNWNYEQEEKIISLNKESGISGFLLTVGLIYGRDFPQIQLTQMLAKAQGKQQIVCFGEGHNFVPTTSIDQLVETIGLICVDKERNPYNLLVDEQTLTQKQIIEAMQTASGRKGEVVTVSQKYLTAWEAKMATSVVLKRSFPPGNTTFKQYLEDCSNISEYLELNPIRAIVDSHELPQGITPTQSQPPAGNKPQAVNPCDSIYQSNALKVDELRNMFLQNGVCIIEEKQLRIAENEQFPTAFERYFSRRPIKSCLFILDEQKVSEQDCKRFGFRRISIEESRFWEQKRAIVKQFGLVVAAEPQEQGEQPNPTRQQVQANASEQLIDKNIEALLVDEIESSKSIPEEPLSGAKKTSLAEQNKKMQQANYLDQYLLDNVLTYISEAYVRLSCKEGEGRQDLRGFICELKHIYEREMAIKEESCIQI